MKNKKRIVAYGVATTMLLALCNMAVSSVQATSNTNEYVIVTEDELSCEEIVEEYEEDVVSSDLEKENTVVVDLTKREVEKLEQNNGVCLVEENILFYGNGFESDSLEETFGMNFESEKEAKMFLKELRDSESAVNIDTQWNMDAINATCDEYKQGTDKIKVAILDTGVSASEDIEVVGRINLIEGEEDVNPLYEDVSGHGTSVASIIAAKDNNIGITGINPNVDLYSVKVLNDQKTANLSGVIQGIYWCMDNDIDIINMSFGTSIKSEILENVVKEANEQGILMIAAAGNSGQEGVQYPAAFDEVIAVGASNANGDISDISSVGTEINLMAPGETVPATGYYDEIVKTDGTSMAAPHVTGIASVLWSKDKKKSCEFIKKLLQISAKPMDETMAGSGLVDLDYALEIYDEFEEEFLPENDIEDYSVKTNTEKIAVYTDAEVEASWHYNDHASAVGTYDETSASALNVIKAGAKLPDTASYLKYSNGTTNSFHGHYNYVANYMYVMRMARICFNSGMSAALSQAQYPCSGAGESQIYNGIVKLNNNWSSVLSGYTINKENKARILVGIASHIAMDAYAHKAYVKGSDGKWNSHISGDANQDSTSYVPNRWTCAKGIAYDIVDVWHYGQTPDAVEFYQPSHNKDKFRLFKFATYTSNADAENYAGSANWYTNRTSD